jgi:predicted transcriptional regulator
MKTIVGTETWEETKGRWSSIAQKLDRGERVAPVRRILFERPADLLDHLTPARRKLLSVVREHPDSVTAVATRLQRPRSAVNRDVQAMQKVGLLKLKKQVNPGHGVVQIVTAPGKVELRATL